MISNVYRSLFYFRKINLQITRFTVILVKYGEKRRKGPTFSLQCPSLTEGRVIVTMYWNFSIILIFYAFSKTSSYSSLKESVLTTSTSMRHSISSISMIAKNIPLPKTRKFLPLPPSTLTSPSLISLITSPTKKKADSLTPSSSTSSSMEIKTTLTVHGKLRVLQFNMLADGLFGLRKDFGAFRCVYL